MSAVLAAIEPAGYDGSPTYLIRNRLPNGDVGRPSVAAVRRVLDRLERLGRVHRTDFTRANQVHWKAGSKPRLRPSPSPLAAEGKSEGGPSEVVDQGGAR